MGHHSNGHLESLSYLVVSKVKLSWTLEECDTFTEKGLSWRL